MVSLRRRMYDRAATAGLAGLAVALGFCVYGLWRPAEAPPPPPEGQRPPPRAAAPTVTESDLAVIGAGPVAPLPKAATPAPVEKPPLTLRGIICAEGGDSAVFVESGGRLSVCRVGEAVEGWTLEMVLPSLARFRRDGKELTLNVERRAYADGGGLRSGVEPGGARTARAGASSGPREEPRRGEPSTAAGPSAGATTGPVVAATPARPMRVSISREVMESARQDPAAALEGVRYEFPTGGQGGILLSAVPVKSLPARCGFAPGDRIVAVNGQPIDSPNRALELYARYRDSASVVVTLERQGKRRDIEYFVP